MSAAQHTAQAATKPATPAPRRILAKDLQLVLVSRRMAQHQPALAQFAAMTGYPMVFTGCTTRRFGLAKEATQPTASPMWTGDLASLASRTQREHGGAEVRRIWGRGIRSLMADPIALRVRHA